MMTNKLDQVSSHTLLSDGAMGTMLHARGIGFDQCFDELNRTNPGAVAEIHRAYIEAGAQLIITNTFGANRFKLGKHGARLAHRLAAHRIPGRPRHLAPVAQPVQPGRQPGGTTNVVDGLAKICGRWAVVIGFDNKWLAGAWVPGQYENILRVTNLSKRLNIPLVWLVNCSGVQLPEQEQFYADRRGGGTCFFRHAELEQMGIPILAGIYGTIPRAAATRALARRS